MISFAEFYQAIHRYPPFPWQERLAARAAAGNWPEKISVPTGCGKTSVIDAAVYALAVQAEPTGRTAAMRVFFVVDRRLVVDDVYAHARDLAKKIEEQKGWAFEQLKRYGGSNALDVVVLRGGMYRNNNWVDAPNQPTLCVSTVDQVGSRLLFRGYGVSEERRPIDAGLVGNDSLIILDEAHLSQPFSETVQAVRRYQGDGWRKVTAPQSLQFVEMSATLGGDFRLEEDDFANETLRRRLDAKKIAELKEVPDVPDAAVEEARRMRKDGAKLVGIVLNTVAAARAAFDQLEGGKVLLTGRIRPNDRDRLLDAYLERMKAGRDRSPVEGLFVVATQTVEVGADLDFDALVTQAAPLDSLRQRFGRLDRLGELQSTKAVIVKSKRPKDIDPVYGEDVDRTWKWLMRRGPAVDFGVKAMADAPTDLNRAQELAPLMFPAHVDCWAQTNPAPAADADVAPFLHGPDATEPPDVQIVWRADLPEDVERWPDILKAVPPISTEALPLPMRAAVRWLGSEKTTVSDQEGTAGDDEEATVPKRAHWIWRGPDQPRAMRIRPGDTIVVRSAEGGCDEFGWKPESDEPVKDIGDLCANIRADAGGGKYRLRVHPQVWEYGDGETAEDLQELLKRAERDDGDAIEELQQIVVRERRELKGSRPKNYGVKGAVLFEKRVKKERLTDESDEGDESSISESFEGPVWLDEHMSRVAKKARLFLDRCGLNGDTVAAVVRAAELHDLGKRDQRFQFKLGNTKPGVFVAKGDGRRRRDAEYPPGARHEFDSVARAAGETLDHCDRDLVLYLIGTHHGYGRPFVPVWSDEENPAAAKMARIDSGWTERFWAMNRKYGWWGVAYLEAMVRKADWLVSAEEEARACQESN